MPGALETLERQGVAPTSEVTHVYCGNCEEIRPIRIVNSCLQCAHCGYAVLPLYMSANRRPLARQRLAEATHTCCPLDCGVVPVEFEGFTGPATLGDFVGGDVMCPQCRFVICTLWREGDPVAGANEPNSRRK
jgi:hypothetical protein